MKMLIAANWKMHGAMDWIKKPVHFDTVLPAKDRKAIDVLICPPALYLAAMVEPAMDNNVFIGAQDCHAADEGAHTGDISAKQIAETGARYVINGHSERRANGETDANVKAKAEAALRHALTPIICVGETLDQRESGEAQAVVAKQLSGSLPEVEGKSFVVAYEPVWAIGTGKTATPSDIADMHNFIRTIVGPDTRILYGGSVKPANAAAIFAVETVNGALIGGAGLDMYSLADIAQAAL
ncbi:triose-phosphate isomerase [Fretibacter rubidus]|uniref:triose-phosphate isomerase n=1 Tax=Fretibacter rubidus TaxID=570162 RepID=UPI00352B0998